MVQNVHMHCPFCRCHLVQKQIPVEALCISLGAEEEPAIARAERPVFGADVTLSSVVTLPGITKTEKMMELGWVELTHKEKLYLTGEGELPALFDTSTLAIKNKKPIVLVNCLTILSPAPLFCFYRTEK